MTAGTLQPDGGGAGTILRRLSALLDEATGPLQRLDLPRVAELTRKQQALLDKLGGALPGPGEESPSLEPALVEDVRRKLLRNRVITAHVLDFAGKVQGRLGRGDAEGYGADGHAVDGGAEGQWIRTSV